MSAVGDIDWLAVDWGTSHLRVWAMDAMNRPVAERRSDRGMGRLARDEFGPALHDALAGLALPPETLTLCCGMVGSRQGWAEAGYRSVPGAPLDPRQLTRFSDHGLDVGILPGLSQKSPADVMRGEETQIAGFLADHPDFDGALCLPGTHSKWVHISAGEVVSFRSFMTGEMFELLADHSVLRHGLSEPGWAEEAFADALSDAMSKPADVMAKLFSLRAENLLQGLPAAHARARLSGFLIGMELAAARPYWLGRDVALIGAEKLNAIYREALSLQGLTATVFAADQAARGGLALVRQALKEGQS